MLTKREPKICEICTSEFTCPTKKGKPSQWGMSQAHWAKRRFCSQKCNAKYLAPIHSRNKTGVVYPKVVEANRRNGLKKTGTKRPTFSKEWRDNISKAQKKRFKETPHWNRGKSGEEIWGEIINHPRYKQDRTTLAQNEKKHLDSRYKQWMIDVKSRDAWRCKIDNKACSGRLEAHHILNWQDYPDLRYEVNNGISLCHNHHPRGRKAEQNMVTNFRNLIHTLK